MGEKKLRTRLGYSDLHLFRDGSNICTFVLELGLERGERGREESQRKEWKSVADVNWKVDNDGESRIGLRWKEGHCPWLRDYDQD